MDLKKNQIRNTVFPILFLFLGAIGLVSPLSISMALFLLLKVRKKTKNMWCDVRSSSIGCDLLDV